MDVQPSASSLRRIAPGADSPAPALESSTFQPLHRADILSLPALGPFGYFKLHSLALLQAAKTACLDCREVYKNIFAALPTNKAVAFGVVKPLYCSLFHIFNLFLFEKDLRWKGVGGTVGRC
jgi:hypothetical protein